MEQGSSGNPPQVRSAFQVPLGAAVAGAGRRIPARRTTTKALCHMYGYPLPNIRRISLSSSRPVLDPAKLVGVPIGAVQALRLGTPDYVHRVRRLDLSGWHQS